MKNMAFLFQGMGVDVRPLLSTLNEAQTEKIKTLCLKDPVLLKYQIKEYLFTFSENNKMITEWLAVYTIGYVIYETYISKGYRPVFFVGYSLGLIVASACTGAVSFTDGARMLIEIEKYRSLHTVENQTMAVIIGKSFQQITSMIDRKKLNDMVYVAIDNNNDCVTLSGIEAGIDTILSMCVADGVIRAEKLKTRYAFHCPLGAAGIESFAHYINCLEVKDLSIPILSVYDQQMIDSSAKLKMELIRNMSSAMMWRTTILSIRDMGIEEFAEVGLDGGLTKISRLIDLDLQFTTIKKINREERFQRV